MSGHGEIGFLFLEQAPCFPAEVSARDFLKRCEGLRGATVFLDIHGSLRVFYPGMLKDVRLPGPNSALPVVTAGGEEHAPRTLGRADSTVLTESRRTGFSRDGSLGLAQQLGRHEEVA